MEKSNKNSLRGVRNIKRILSTAAFLGVAIFVVFAIAVPSAAGDETFFQMVRSDDVAGVEAAIAEGQDVNARDRIGRTALFLISGDVRTAEVLIRAGADVNARDSSKQTPLHVYSSPARSRANVVEALLAASADVNAADGGGYTPLHLAVTILMRNPKEKLRITQMLLDAGANVNARLQDGMTPLMQASLAAALAPDDDVQHLVEMLLKAGADVKTKDAGGMSALHCWSSHEKPGVIRLLLEAGADVDSPGIMSPLMWAICAPDNLQVTEMLLEAGADVNAVSEGMTALSLAAALGKAKDVAVLLKAGAALRDAPGGLTPLHLATGFIAMERQGVTGSFEERAKQVMSSFALRGQEFRPDFLGAAKLLVEAGAAPDAKSGKSLKDAFTFSTGITDVDYKQFADKTPLEFARIVGNEEVVKYLSEASPSRRK
jgi:ankyrin repeat protein